VLVSSDPAALDNLAAAMNGVDGPPEQRPAADQLTFVTIGDPTNPQGILHWLPGRVPVIGVSPVDVHDTPYDTVIVNREYDGWADVHGRYLELGPIDLDAVRAENVTETTNSAGGKTTTYLVPTDKLPRDEPSISAPKSDESASAAA
jgi:hypothetical protein